MDCMDPRQGAQQQGHPTRFNAAILATDALKDYGAERTRVRGSGQTEEQVDNHRQSLVVCCSAVKGTMSW
jgi:hypothetical protein